MFGLNEIVGKKYFQDASDKLFVTSIFYTMQGEGPYRGLPALFVRLAKCNLGCSWCFHGNTDITMGDGSKKKIKDIKVGDNVISWNTDVQKFEIKPVTHVHPPREVDEIIRLRTGGKNSSNPNDVVYVTSEHPFLVKNRGWVKAGDLETGDVLLRFTKSDSMSMFNPKSTGPGADAWSDSFKKSGALVASKRMKALWEDPEFRRMKVEYAINENPMKNPEIAAKGYMTRKDRGRKTSIEKLFENIVEGLPIKFIGDGSMPIGHKFPDFIVDGQNKLIEVWAEDALFAQQRNSEDSEWRQKRAALFKKYGFETLFLPMHIRHYDANTIRNKVIEFIHNGDTVTSVEKITKPSVMSGSEGKAWVRLAGGSNDIKVYNFETEDNHTYVANSKIVHNCDAFFDDGDWMTVEEVLVRGEEEIRKYYNGAAPEWVKDGRLVFVVTGGEPSLQNIKPLLEEASKRYKWTQIESNGVYAPDVPDSTTVVISPKCNEKVDISQGFKRYIPTKYMNPNPDTLARADCLKFIVEDQPEFDSPYQTIPDWAHEWHKRTGRDIFISPMNIYNKEPEKAKLVRAGKNRVELIDRSTVDEVVSWWEKDLFNMEANQRNHEHAARYALQHGFTFQMQLHLFASFA